MNTKEQKFRALMDKAVRYLELASEAVDGSEPVQDCIDLVDRTVDEVAKYLTEETSTE